MLRFLMDLRLSSAAAAFAVTALVGVQANAVVLIDDNFTAAEGYNDAALQFQQPNGAGNGIWLGQANTMVNTTDGVVEGRGGGFLRNLWSLGANGAAIGAGGDEIGSGFSNNGDVIKITSEFQFTLPDTGNAGVHNFGVTDCFAQCGFNPVPRAGVATGWNNFGAGAYKVFTDIRRNHNNGADNPFGVLLGGPDVGIINGMDLDDMGQPISTGEPLDLESDMLRIEYTAELTDAANQQWTATELVITNVTTDTVLTTASVDDPQALESFFWNDAADDPFTEEVNEAGVAAHPTNPGSEMWFAGLWVPDSDPLQETNVSNVRFEYIPNLPPVDGDYTGDGLVDAADYTVWRDTNESVGGGLAADGTGDDLLGIPDGDVDSFDRDFWAANYGAPGTPASAAIPEPATALLVVLGAVATGLRRR